MELIDVLTEHAKRYPLIQPCDAEKLIFQNELGGGHLVADPEQSLLRIRQEHSSVARDPNALLYESIGNGLVRVNLAALDCQEYPLERLNGDFIASSTLVNGTRAGLISKLSILSSRLCELGFTFTDASLGEYLLQYEKAGYPAVSHSEIYRSAYRPAYRVVLRELACKRYD